MKVLFVFIILTSFLKGEVTSNLINELYSYSDLKKLLLSESSLSYAKASNLDNISEKKLRDQLIGLYNSVYSPEEITYLNQMLKDAIGRSLLKKQIKKHLLITQIKENNDRIIFDQLKRDFDIKDRSEELRKEIDEMTLKKNSLRENYLKIK